MKNVKSFQNSPVYQSQPNTASRSSATSLSPSTCKTPFVTQGILISIVHLILWPFLREIFLCNIQDLSSPDDRERRKKKEHFDSTYAAVNSQAAQNSRVYGLSLRGIQCQKHCCPDGFEYSSIDTDWSVYGWVCYNHRSTVLRMLTGPMP